ncbi:hypothetical protein L0244_31780, partial [bacterium]|nr:hypothetical protein [bacterium]MCI0617578.1 hypothetical protein [bacterium]
LKKNLAGLEDQLFAAAGLRCYHPELFTLMFHHLELLARCYHQEARTQSVITLLRFFPTCHT